MNALSGAPTDVLDHFRAWLRAHGTPLFDAAAGTATFVWEEPPADASTSAAAGSATDSQVPFVWVNRLTDKQHFARGVMHRIPGTPLWVRELEFAPAARHSYGFLHVDAAADSLGGPPPLRRGGVRRDPWNPRRPVLDFGGGFGSSSAAGPDAPRQVEWEAAEEWDGPRGSVVSDVIQRSDAKRTAYLYVPHFETGDAAEIPLLALLDGDEWFERAGLADALDRAIGAGRFGPVAVLGLAPRADAPRMQDMCAGDGMLADLVDHALPWAETQLADRGIGAPSRGSARRAVAGGSLGGYVALRAAIEAPDEFGAVLAQSPSLWANPAGGSPRDLPDLSRPAWLARRVRDAPEVPAARIVLSVGSHEGPSHVHVADLAATLTDRGADVETRMPEGGHDVAWWRGELFDFLAELAGPERTDAAAHAARDAEPAAEHDGPRRRRNPKDGNV